MRNETKVVFFSDVARGEKRWATHFYGRPGVTRTLVSAESSVSSEGHAPGLYIEMPAAIGEAWDRGVRMAQRSKSNNGAALIEAELDRVARRPAK